MTKFTIYVNDIEYGYADSTKEIRNIFNILRECNVDKDNASYTIRRKEDEEKRDVKMVSGSFTEESNIDQVVDAVEEFLMKPEEIYFVD